MYARRIAKELSNIRASKLSGIEILETVQNTNETVVRVSITGAQDTLYADEKHILVFKFSNRYPLVAPEVVFEEPAPVNEHVYSNGHICMSILYDNWSPAMTIESVCISVLSLLSGSRIKRRPPNDKFYCRESRGKGPKEFKWSYD